MNRSLKEAAETFVELHKPDRIDVYHIEKTFGSVEGLLLDMGSYSCDNRHKGEMHIEIKSSDHVNGVTEAIDWYVDCFQISYFRLPAKDRITAQDHTPELLFDSDFDWCLDQIEDLKSSGCHDITLNEMSEGSIKDRVPPSACIDGWGAQ